MKAMPVGRYLVAGGAGFIGSHICEQLLKQGSEVIAVDNLVTGSIQNIKELQASKKFQFLEHDVINSLEIKGELSGVFQFASPASPVDYAKLPIETLRVGALGSDELMQLAVKKKCRIIIASTSEVYGDPLEHPQKESYWGNVNPIGPRSCYDESKRYQEALTMAYNKVHGVETRIVRIFNTYGPRMRTNDGRVVPNFCLQALQNEAVTVYGDGKQTRSFCYVDDLVDGIFSVYTGSDITPFNLGNPLEKTILEFAEMIIRLCRSSSKVKFLELPIDDPKRRKPDITKATGSFDWKPRVELEEGLNRTIEYFKAQI